MSLEVTTPGDRDIVLTRAFQAPARLVFAAYTQPDLLRRWYGARGWNLVGCEVDLRVGGRYRFVSQGPGGDRMTQRGEFRVVERDRRLVCTELFDEQSYPGETLLTHDFTESAGPGPVSTVVTTRVRYATPQGRARVLQYPMTRGVGEAGDRLETLLKERTTMNWTLEVVIVPVSDVDRAKAFYADQLGFNVDHDSSFGEGQRIVQLTPPGSGCSVVIGKGAVPEMPPGSLKGLQLVVPDIHKAHAQLVERGVEVTDVQTIGVNPRPVDDPLDNVGFVFFSDPDGNAWAVQQISSRG